MAGSEAVFQREVRFGVVMYGGVSLAVYINGVAQELLSLVRATAPAIDPATMTASDSGLRYRDDELTPVERVYRQLARSGDEPTDPVTTRFVVDIISGSSAGGINGVYLAKALTRGQRIDSLKALWTERAGIGSILNDRMGRSERADVLTRPEPVDSLFSGDRMYVELLDALDGMELLGSGASLVDELDLWVTATDLDGLVEPLQLADGAVPERRHRHVFHFAHGDDQAGDGRLDDFTADRHPILAFAARATSSFPFAFVPAQLADIERVIRSIGDERGRPDPEDPRWRRWFAPYLQLPGYDHTRVNFGDGGGMDNKPFGWVIDTLASRTSVMPVDRKLLYIEPDPGDIRQQHEPPPRPDAVASVVTAASLGRVETIRDEVERLARRSAVLAQVRSASDRMATRFERGEDTPDATTTQEWLAEAPAQLRARGAAYETYLRLRVDHLLTEFGRSLAQLGWADAATVRCAAYQALARHWVEQRYVDPFDREATDDEPSWKHLLLDFDIGFRVRRLAFTAHRIDVAMAHLDRGQDDLDDEVADGFDRTAARAEFHAIKRILGDAERWLRLWMPGVRAHRRLDIVDDVFPLDDDDLQAFSADATTWAASAWADPDRRTRWLDAVGDIARFLWDPDDADIDDPEQRRSVFGRASAMTGAALAEIEDPADPADRARAWARSTARRHYAQFGNFDQVIFPLQVASGGGEMDAVEVHRVSPLDATSLLGAPSRPDDAHPEKVAGIRLGHFGGFLDARWRANDIMWGRLDAAERLITVLAPPARRDRLIADAHDAILVEEWFAPGRPGHADAVPDTAAARRAAFQESFAVPTWPPTRDLLRLGSRTAAVTTDVSESTADRPGAALVHRVVGALAWMLAVVVAVFFPGGVTRSPFRALAVAVAGVGGLLVAAGRVADWRTGTDAGWTLVAVGVPCLIGSLLYRLGWRRPLRFVVGGAVGAVVALAAVGAADIGVFELDANGRRTFATAVGLAAGVTLIGLIQTGFRVIRSWYLRRR